MFILAFQFLRISSSKDLVNNHDKESSTHANVPRDMFTFITSNSESSAQYGVLPKYRRNDLTCATAASRATSNRCCWIPAWSLGSIDVKSGETHGR